MGIQDPVAIEPIFIESDHNSLDLEKAHQLDPFDKELLQSENQYKINTLKESITKQKENLNPPPLTSALVEGGESPSQPLAAEIDTRGISK